MNSIHLQNRLYVTHIAIYKISLHKKITIVNDKDKNINHTASITP